MGSVGGLEKAIEFYPAIAEYNAVIEGLSDKFNRLKPYVGGAATKDFARVADSLGETDDLAQFKTIGDAVIKGVQNSSNEITPSDMLSALKYLRTAKYGVSKDFIQNYMPGIIGDVKTKSGGASSAGVGLASLYDQFYNLRATNAAKEQMEATGLTTGKFERNDKGKIIGRGTASLLDRESFRKNMQEWATKTFDPYLRKQAGIGADVSPDSDEYRSPVQDILGKLTSNRNASDTAVAMLFQREEREREARSSRTMPGVDALPLLRKQSPVNTLQQVTATTKNLGADAMESTVEPLQWLGQTYSNLVNRFRSFRKEKPDQGDAIANLVSMGAAGVVGGAGYGAVRLWGALQNIKAAKLADAIFRVSPSIAEDAAKIKTPSINQIALTPKAISAPQATLAPEVATTTPKVSPAPKAISAPQATLAPEVAAPTPRFSATKAPGAVAGAARAGANLLPHLAPLIALLELDEVSKRAPVTAASIDALAKKRAASAEAVDALSKKQAAQPPAPEIRSDRATLNRFHGGGIGAARQPAPYPEREAERGREMMRMKFDGSAVEAALERIKVGGAAAGESLKTSLNITATPTVDPTSINAALALAQQLKATLDGVTAAATSAAAKVSSAIAFVKGSNAPTGSPVAP